MPDNRIQLRLFVEVADIVEAEDAAAVVKAMLATYGRICRADEPKRYWKIPAYFEVFFIVKPEDGIRIVFQRIMSMLATGWDVQLSQKEGDWAVWNASVSGQFYLSNVRWAHMECYDESQAPADGCIQE